MTRTRRFASVPLVIAALAVATAVPAVAAETLSVRITGAAQGVIQGDHSRAGLGRENTIEGLEYHHLVATPAGTAQLKHETIILTKPYDKATPKLWRAMSNRELLQVEFWHFRVAQDGTTEVYYKVILGNARIIGIEQITGSVLDPQLATWPSVERVRFEYQTLTITWPINGDSVTLNTTP